MLSALIGNNKRVDLAIVAMCCHSVKIIENCYNNKLNKLRGVRIIRAHAVTHLQNTLKLAQMRAV